MHEDPAEEWIRLVLAVPANEMKRAEAARLESL